MPAVVYLNRHNGDVAVCIDRVCPCRQSQLLIEVGVFFSLRESLFGCAMTAAVGRHVEAAGFSQAEDDRDELWPLAVSIHVADDRVIGTLAATHWTVEHPRPVDRVLRGIWQVRQGSSAATAGERTIALPGKNRLATPRRQCRGTTNDRPVASPTDVSS